MRRFRTLSTSALRAMFFVSLVALGGCGESALSPSGEVSRQQALARWTAQGLQQYTVEVRISCFCAPEVHQWHRITVVNDVVTDVVRVEPSEDPGTPETAWYATVNEIFARIATAGSATDGSRVSAEYDATTGLPTLVSFEAPPGVADGGSVYYYRGLQPLPVP